ncbi:Fusaric acid resistance protein-like-domain-containing protein [Phycomyces nitens]|nr:Fusaric acid resistance protein-like-domain-containing protein [Phycomyces nitens]
MGMNLGQWTKSLFVGKKELWKKITKCTIAYELATIMILIPKVSPHLGVVPYLFPLGTLFFNPSGTTGNQCIEMVLNVGMMIIPAIWSAIICYLCTLYNKAILDGHTGLYSNGAGVIAGISFGISMMGVAYYRLKYPRLYIPALQGFTTPMFALTKGIYETSFDIMSIVGIFYPIIMGGALALLTNIVFWPETASKSFETSLENVLCSLSQILDFVHTDILKNDDAGIMSADIELATKLSVMSDKLQAEVTKMHKAWSEAKYEVVVSHFYPRWYKETIHSVEALCQNMLGFSLSIEKEARIMQEIKVSRQLDESYASKEKNEYDTLRQRQPGVNNLDVYSTNNMTNSISASHPIKYLHIVRLQNLIQPELKQFLWACKKIMEEIRIEMAERKAIPGKHALPKHQEHTSPDFIQNTESICSLDKALGDIKATYILLHREFKDRNMTPLEEHYLVYTIVFTLIEFGREMKNLEVCVNKLLEHRKPGSWSRLFFPKVPLKKWLSKGGNDNKGEHDPIEQTLFSQELERVETRPGLRTRNSSTSEIRDTSTIISRRRSVVSVESDYGEFVNEEYPLHNAPGKHIWNQWLRSIFDFFRTGPARYAIKYGIVTELLAFMAWLPIPGVNQLYNENHGQWALLSAMVVFNYTVGSTMQQCFYRIVATILGAVCGYIALLAGNRNENPYVIAVLVLVFQIPLWYLLLGSAYPRIGFISLLTLSVIVSTGYSNDTNETLFDPVWKRTITSIIAVLVVMLIDNMFWPVWARKVMRKQLADLLNDTGIQYSKVASLVCQENTSSYRYQATLADTTIQSKRLSKQLQAARDMLQLSCTEPRVSKAPFPYESYRKIMDHEQKILYWINHMMKSQKLIRPEVRKGIMTPMNPFRKRMASIVHLYLFTLSGSLGTKSALPASLPSAEESRRKLQQRQAELWKEQYDTLYSMDISKSHSGCDLMVYWHTYAAGSVEVVMEEEAIGAVVAKLMGQHIFRAATKDWTDV